MEEHPRLHQCHQYLIHVLPIKFAKDHFITVKEAIKFLSSLGGHTLEIITYPLPF